MGTLNILLKPFDFRAIYFEKVAKSIEHLIPYGNLGYGLW